MQGGEEVVLFSYKSINHDIEALHGFLAHTVFEVWCKPDGDFDINMLHPNLLPIANCIKTYLLEPIKEIYMICCGLNDAQRTFIADAFRVNNRIQDLCEGSINPVLYDDIRHVHNGLADKLKDFCENLYIQVIGRKTFTNRHKSLNEYYKEFVGYNNKGKCPFCGLNDIKSKLLTKRDAFDHYLPKSLLPFNSVNLVNLAPACNDCNSSYKLAQNPIMDPDGNRRKAFFPYATSDSNLIIKIEIEHLDSDPQKNNLNISITSTHHQEEVDTWRQLYGIDERYEDKCCSLDSKYWLEQINEAANYNIDSTTFIDDQIQLG